MGSWAASWVWVVGGGEGETPRPVQELAARRGAGQAFQGSPYHLQAAQHLLQPHAIGTANSVPRAAGASALGNSPTWAPRGPG